MSLDSGRPLSTIFHQFIKDFKPFWSCGRSAGGKKNHIKVKYSRRWRRYVLPLYNNDDDNLKATNSPLQFPFLNNNNNNTHHCCSFCLPARSLLLISFFFLNSSSSIFVSLWHLIIVSMWVWWMTSASLYNLLLSYSVSLTCATRKICSMILLSSTTTITRWWNIVDVKNIIIYIFQCVALLLLHFSFINIY